MFKIAVIGTGNVGSSLARRFADKGHEIFLGVRTPDNFKGIEMLEHKLISAFLVPEAVSKAEIIIVSTPAPAAIEVAMSLGDTSGKVIIDTMNIVGGRGPEGYPNTAKALLDNTQTSDVVKCFNTTGFNNMKNPFYHGTPIDSFVAGDSKEGKEIAIQLSEDLGFANCYDVGGNDRFTMMEQFAWFWINLAMVQGQGREIGFKLLKR